MTTFENENVSSLLLNDPKYSSAENMAVTQDGPAIAV